MKAIRFFRLFVLLLLAMIADSTSDIRKKDISRTTTVHQNNEVEQFYRSEWQALRGIFDENGGERWNWYGIYSRWNFTGGMNAHNPCTELWQGVECSCQSSSPLHPYSHESRDEEFNIYYDDASGVNISSNATSQNVSCSITKLHLVSFGLTGKLSASIANFPNLTHLHLDGNYLSGDLSVISSAALPKLKTFTCRKNLLLGPFPSFLIELNILSTIDLSHNGFTGTIPDSMTFSKSLQHLLISDNFFSGVLLQNLFNESCGLRVLKIANNNFRGTLPVSLLNCADLDVLDVSNNQFQGLVLQEIFLLPNIRFVSLANNKFHGGLFPSWRAACQQNSSRSFPRLQTVNISSNLFIGEVFWDVMSTYYPSLNTLDMSNNHFTGSLSQQLCQCTSVEKLSIANNSFVGQLLDCVNDLQSLNELDMSYNKFSGEIPEVFFRLPLLQKLTLAYNKLSGRIDGVPADTISNSLYMLLLNNNLLTGEIPTPWTYLTNIKVLLLNNNYFSTFPTIASDFINSTTSLEILDVSTNLLQGNFPDEYLFALMPSLHSFFAVQNCFTVNDDDLHSLLRSFCDYTPSLKILALDGMSSACTSTRYSQFYDLSIRSKRSLPECLFQLPKLTTLALSGINLLGTIPHNFTSQFNDMLTYNQSKLKTLILSHNMLSGTIPEALQYHSWTELDLSYNKLNGILSQQSDFALSSTTKLTANRSSLNSSSNIELYFQANRLSGDIPRVYHADIEHLSILQGNLFTCKYDRRDLPMNDPLSGIYSCGTNAINVLILIWVGFYFFGLIIQLVSRVTTEGWWKSLFQSMWLEKLLLFSHQRHIPATTFKNTIFENEEASHEERENEYQQISPVLFAFLQGMHYLYSFLFWYGVYLLVFVMIIYGVLGMFYKSHEVTYAYIVSGGFFSGTVPGVLLYCTWLVGWCLLLKISYHLSGIHAKAQGKTTFNELASENREINWRNKDVIRVMVLLAVTIIFFIIVIILLNIAFLYTQITFSVYYQFIAQCVMSFCKIFLRKVIIPAVFSWIFGLVIEVDLWKKIKKPSGRKKSQVNVPNEPLHVALVDEKEELHAKKAWCYFYQLTIEVLFGIFVTILAPGVATAVYDINCFYYTTLAKPPLVSSVYSFQYCVQFSAANNCERYSTIEHNANYQPSYEYSCQCASVLLSNYLFVFIFMLILDEFVKPFARKLYIYFYDLYKYPPDFLHCNYWKQFIQVQPVAVKTALSPQRKMLHMHDFISSANFGKGRHSMENKSDVILQLEEKPFLLLLLNYLSILFTFGLMFPPLGIMICIFLSRNLFKVFHLLNEFFEEVLDPKFLFPLPPFCKEIIKTLRMDQLYTSEKVDQRSIDKHHREMLIKSIIIASEKRIQYCLLLVIHLLFWVLIPLNVSYMHHFTFDCLADDIGLKLAIVPITIGLSICSGFNRWLGNSVIAREKKMTEQVVPVKHSAVSPENIANLVGMLQQKKNVIHAKQLTVKSSPQRPVNDKEVHDINAVTPHDGKDNDNENEVEEEEQEDDEEGEDESNTFFFKRSEKRGSTQLMQDEENQMNMRRTPSRKVSTTRRPAMITKHLEFTPEVAEMVESVELQNLVEEFGTI